MGRVKIGSAVLPLTLNHLLAAPLCAPTRTNTLGVGIAYRGSKLDHFRTYACNGTFRTFSQALGALTKAWGKTLEGLATEVAELPQQLQQLVPHTDLFTAAVKKEAEVGTEALLAGFPDFLRGHGVEPVTVQVVSRKRATPSPASSPGPSKRLLGQVPPGSSAAEILWSFSLKPGGFSGLQLAPELDELPCTDLGLQHSPTFRMQQAPDSPAKPSTSHGAPGKAALEGPHVNADSKQAQSDSCETSLNVSLGDSPGAADGRTTALAHRVVTSPWDMSDADKAVVLGVLADYQREHALSDSYRDVEQLRADVLLRGVDVAPDVLCGYLEWMSGAHEAERARGIALPNILYMDHSFTFMLGN